MIKIKFIKPYGKREGQGAGPHYEVDQEATFKGVIDEGYAHAYIARGVAVEVKDEPKPVVKPVEKQTLKMPEKPADGQKAADFKR